MIGVLRDVSVTCFFTSYAVVLGLELLRLAGRIPGRAVAVIAMTAVGIFTHVVFLSIGSDADGGWLASWSEWSLLIALVLAVCFLGNYLRRPETIVGLFFLPAVLATIALAVAVRSWPPFPRDQAAGIWRTIHGGSMMIGVAVVIGGFLAGLMCLVQSWRLKNHRAGSALKLPTMETLLRWNRSSMIAGAAAVGVGLVSGVVMNWNRWGHVGWTSGGVLLSAGLFAWLVAATGIDAFFGTAHRNRRGVWMTIAAGGFLVMTMAGVLADRHVGGGDARPGDAMPDDSRANVPLHRSDR